jgi:predicted permease
MVSDLRHAWRGLWRTPGFAIVTILTLGLGIGASTAIFSLVSALLLEDLPFREPQRLASVWRDLSDRGYPRAPLAGPEIEDLRHGTRVFSGFGGIWSNTAVLTGTDPEQLRIGLVTPDFFDILGAAPAIGRTFTAADDGPDASPVILLSHALWQRRFGPDTSLVGRTIQVNHRGTTVIGVMPRGFRLLMPPDASVPDDLQAWLLLPSSHTVWPRGQQFLRVVGRMKPGVRLDEARQEVAAIGARAGREHAYYGRAGLTLYAVGLHAEAVREIRPTLLALLAGVGILLLVSGVNVASLLVARAAARTRETAVRVALGAGTARLLRQYAVEGLVLGALGGALGVVLGDAILAGLIAMRPAALSRLDMAAIDPRVIAFAAGLAIVWGLLFSLAPLAEVGWSSIAGRLQGAARGAGGAALPYRRRAALVVCQLALSVVLIVSAGLLARAFVALVNVDPGFTTENVLTFRLALSGERFRSREAANTFRTELLSRLGALPGVTGAGAISHVPYDDLPNWGTPYIREGEADVDKRTVADTRAITPGLLEALGARLVEGRFFTESDDVKTMPVAIVDERLARRAWPGESAIGKRFLGDPMTSGTASVQVTVVGVVRHLRHRQPMRELGEQIYYPVRQAPRNPMAYLIRTTGDRTALTAQIRETLRSLDASLPIYDVRPLAAYAAGARAARRFALTLAGAFAASALLLAAIGVYGVTAYAVAFRRREIGLRVALGASRQQIAGLVIGESLRLGAAGLLLGLAGAGVAAALLRSQLFAIPPTDVAAYAAAVPVLAIAVAVATWLPARRATRVSPLESLRTE